jgi:hypothetical protein
MFHNLQRLAQKPLPYSLLAVLLPVMAAAIGADQPAAVAEFARIPVVASREGGGILVNSATASGEFG